MKKDITLSERKKIQLDLMQDIHDFCVKHNIKYSLGYGTLIGAIRHKGFIPWDDDIDIFMLREDYDKFIKLYQGGKSYYILHEINNDPTYDLTYAKLEDSRTLVEEAVCVKNIGLFIDIFPIDNMADDYEESYKLKSSLNLLYRIALIKLINISRTKVNFLKKSYYWIGKLILAFTPLHLISEKIIQKALRVGKPNSVYVGLMVDRGYRDKEILKREYFTSYSLVTFEDRNFYILENYDAVLKTHYGNYMKFPPEDQRTSGHLFDNIYWKE